LIDNGLLISNEYAVSTDGKKIKKYETVFNNIKMDIERNIVVVKIQLKQSSLSQSSIFQVIHV
jgi:hypothetical protein